MHGPRCSAGPGWGGAVFHGAHISTCHHPPTCNFLAPPELGGWDTVTGHSPEALQGEVGHSALPGHVPSGSRQPGSGATPGRTAEGPHAEGGSGFQVQSRREEVAAGEEPNTF